MMLPSGLLRCVLISSLSAAGLIFSNIVSNADEIATLSFVSPGTSSPLTVLVGTTVTFELNLSFVPLAGTVSPPQFIDDGTSAIVASCTSDPNPCTEEQFSTTSSTLVTAFAEAIAGNKPGIPNFFPASTLGATTFSQTYPNPGLWEITLAGADGEAFNEIECTTQFTNAVAGPPSCASIHTFPLTGNLDPGGIPSIFVNVVAAAVAEPSSAALLAVGLLGCGILFNIGRGPARRHRPARLLGRPFSA